MHCNHFTIHSVIIRTKAFYFCFRLTVICMHIYVYVYNVHCTLCRIQKRVMARKVDDLIFLIYFSFANCFSLMSINFLCFRSKINKWMDEYEVSIVGRHWPQWSIKKINDLPTTTKKKTSRHTIPSLIYSLKPDVILCCFGWKLMTFDSVAPAILSYDLFTLLIGIQF